MTATAQEEIWEILRRLTSSFEETDRQMKETDRKLQETDRIVKETSLQMKETDRKLQETGHKIDKVTAAIGRLGNRLGEFVEEMVRPAVVRLFQGRGIDVHQVYARIHVERDGDSMEIDLLVVNTTDAILVETKSELKVDDVNEHVSRLVRFKKLRPQYACFQVMGALAAMVLPEDAARYAYRQGLFVLGQSSDTVNIRNDAEFKPKVW